MLKYVKNIDTNTGKTIVVTRHGNGKLTCRCPLNNPRVVRHLRRAPICKHIKASAEIFAKHDAAVQARS